jgi:hypothetical protein
VTVQAAVQGMARAAAEQPMDPGSWTPRQLILHLAYWDQEFLRALEPALLGNRPPWAGEGDEPSDRRDLDGFSHLQHLDWDEAMRELHLRRQELMDALESVPEEPITMWAADQPLGWLVQFISRHDLHHATALKQWRARSGV